MCPNVNNSAMIKTLAKEENNSINVYLTVIFHFLVRENISINVIRDKQSQQLIPKSLLHTKELPATKPMPQDITNLLYFSRFFFLRLTI